MPLRISQLNTGMFSHQVIRWPQFGHLLLGVIRLNFGCSFLSSGESGVKYSRKSLLYSFSIMTGRR